MRMIWGRNPASLLCFLNIFIPADGTTLVSVGFFPPFVNEHKILQKGRRELGCFHPQVLVIINNACSAFCRHQPKIWDVTTS